MRQIPFSPPDITEEEVREVADALRSGWITTGPRTKEFEKRIAEYCHTQRAVCLNSDTACMEMTLRLFDIGPGDEVITTAYTYTATASVICHTGAVPVLVDVAEGSYESAITFYLAAQAIYNRLELTEMADGIEPKIAAAQAGIAAREAWAAEIAAGQEQEAE